MFQSFHEQGSKAHGQGRLTALRARMAAAGIDAVLVPRADAFQGEYVADRDARLAWLTGFTGSAGMAVVTADAAALFVDGRYRVQARAQVDDAIEIRNIPADRPGPWLAERLSRGARVGFDPWLHTRAEIDRLRDALGDGLGVVPVDNPVDDIWTDRPDPPMGQVRPYPDALAGRTAADKRADIAADLKAAGHAWAVLTLPDSIAWLLNIRGSDIPRIPIVHGFALIEAETARVRLFVEADKMGDLSLADVDIFPPDAILQALSALSGPVRVDRDSAPFLFGHALEEAHVQIAWDADPCLIPKACKTAAEIAATRDAHLRDGAAMCAFLHWLDTRIDNIQAGARVTEIDVVTALEGFRRAGSELTDISFETIAGSGPHGAITHYRVTEASNRALEPGDLMLVDSGGQYTDGTTDITRTVPVGAPDEAQIAAFTRVLQGMIAVSRLRWPTGLAGRDLDAVARAPLWMAGQDYDHGTGHGVGVHLSVHEGPQRLSRSSDVALRPGMILSNEPGYYRDGAWGIRIENLIVVQEAPEIPTADPDREMLSFDTLTWAPIDRRLIDRDALSPVERAWLNAYHAAVARHMTGRLSSEVAAWLDRATQPL